MKSKSLIFWNTAFVFVFLLLFYPISAMAQTPPAEAKSLFVNGNVGAEQTFPLQAFAVINNEPYLLDTGWITSYELGPMGLAIDEANKLIFVSFECSNTIEVVDAETLVSAGSFTVDGAEDLCGIDVHQGRGHLYIGERNEPDIYVYDTTSLSQVDHWSLPSDNVVWGIDLLEDENLLFTADLTETVRYYDIDTKALDGSITLTYPASAIAVNSYPEKVIFTQGFDGAASDQPYAIKYEIDTGIETMVMTGTNCTGVSIDPAGDIGYAVADNKFHVIDLDTMNIASTFTLIQTWQPTDILASPLYFPSTVKKTSTTHPLGNIHIGQTVKFKIEIQNLHENPIHVLPLTDSYDTDQLSFVSADPPADDSIDDGELTWSDLIVQEGNDLVVGEKLVITTTFVANEACEGEVSGTNTASMHDVKDDQGGDVDDATGTFDYQIDCACDSHEECDDGQYCNGLELCGDDHVCRSPGNPCPEDDGLYCNGTETDSCDEELDECGHTGDPCEENEECNEETDACDLAGDDDDDDNDDDFDDQGSTDDDDNKASVDKSDEEDNSGCGS